MSSADETRTDNPLQGYQQAMNELPLRHPGVALIVVDLQRGSCDPQCGFVPALQRIGHRDVMKDYRRRIEGTVLPQVSRLLSSFRRVNAPVIYLCVGTIVGDFSDMPARFLRAKEYWEGTGAAAPFARYGQPEMEILPQIAPQPHEPVVPKTSYSGFYGTPLDRILLNRGVNQIVVCGVSTEACVESTLRSGVDRGYDAILVEDACASITLEVHERGVASMRHFARVADAASIVAELGSAATGADASA